MGKLIDNHYYAIANKASLTLPKDLNAVDACTKGPHRRPDGHGLGQGEEGRKAREVRRRLLRRVRQPGGRCLSGANQRSSRIRLKGQLRSRRFSRRNPLTRTVAGLGRRPCSYSWSEPVLVC